MGNKDITDNFNKCMIISIEFCIGFKAVNFLFTEIQDFFKGYGDTFFKNVEPFIFSDILKNEKINDQTYSFVSRATLYDISTSKTENELEFSNYYYKIQINEEVAPVAIPYVNKYYQLYTLK